MQELPFGKPQIRRQLDTPLEAAVRDLQPQYIGIPAGRRQRASTGDEQRLPFDLDAYRLGRKAWQRGNDPKLPLGLEHIDGGLPSGRPRSAARGLAELPMQLLGLFEQGARLGPHLVFRITHRQPLTLPHENFGRSILALGKQR